MFFFKTRNKKIINILIITIFTLFFIDPKETLAKDEDKKKCQFCEKYEKLKDWPESERAEAFIYEKFEYPEGMFKSKKIKIAKTEKLKAGARQAEAGKMVYARFIKSKSSLNKYQHLMIRDMAYFEALFNEMLMDPEAKVETLENLKKGREAMRMSLQISSKAKTSEAVLKFWAVGKMLKKAKKKKQKIDPEVAERAAILSNLKKQIAVAKVNAQRAAVIEAQNQIDKAK